MSTPLPDELLSAYLDGELSAEERQRVEQSLRDEPTRQELLNEFHSLKQAVRQLPVPTAPAGFADDVVAHLPLPAASPVASATKPRVRLPQIFSALAACLVVGASVWIVNGFPFGAPFQSSPESLATNDSLSGDLVADAHSPMIAPTAGNSTIDANAALEMDIALGDESDQFRDPVARQSGGFGSPLAATMAAPQAMAADGIDEEQLRDRLLVRGRVPTTGELLSYLDTVDDQPVVVEYVVADVQEALGQVQVLLNRNGVRPLTANSPATNRQADDLVAIYLEANEQEVSQLLNDIQSLSLVTTETQQAPAIRAMRSQAAPAAVLADAGPNAPAAGAAPSPTPGPNELSGESKSRVMQNRLTMPPAENRLAASRKTPQLDSTALPPTVPQAELIGELNGVTNPALVPQLTRPQDKRVDGDPAPAAKQVPGVRLMQRESDSFGFQIPIPAALELKDALQYSQEQPRKPTATEKMASEQLAETEPSQPRRRIVLFLQQSPVPAADASDGAN
ncbi:MAG: zf-HC2 domain-containing protein [Planctomycetaceae bacterium]|nr:zf-HC2 domain-containing protein [Planctomycetaceae bacterium]